MAIQTATAFRKAIRSVTADEPAVTDRELLRRFLEHADQAAFASVVGRHTGMVLGVCRRLLTNQQDAEDACQATFLVLARKAKGVRWRSSVANWLYATARKVAQNARVAAERRARREAKAAVSASVPPVDRMTGRELLAVLDEELDRLPPSYREPLILCYLEGLTRDEAAVRLGIAVETLKVRIHRGRKRLHNALTKGGCALGAGLLALAATSPAGASPSRLIEAIRASAVGNPPPAVAALAEGVAVNGFVKKSLLGVVALAAAAALVIGLGEPTTTTAGQQPEKAMPAKSDTKGGKDKAAAKAADEKTRTVTGKVVDPVGKAVAGAEIVHLPIDGTATVAGKTTDDGTFKVTVPLKSPGSYLFPRVAGFASSNYLMPATNTPGEITFKLIKDTPIRGRVIDTQGKPVAGVSVAVRHLAGYANDSMDGFLNSWLKRSSDSNGVPSKWFVNFRSWEDRKPPEKDGAFAAVTDKDGRFTIANVGSDRLVTLHVRGPGIAEAEVPVVTRSGFDPEPYNQATAEKIRSPYSELGYHPMLYSPEPTIVAEAEKPIRGVVTETDTGKPRAGVMVSLRGSRTVRLPSLTATTDAEGRFEIRGAKKAQQYEFSVGRDVKASMLGRRVTAVDTPAYEPVTVNIGVAKGVIIIGRVLDDSTKKPVPGFACIGILADNEFLKSRLEFDTPDCYDFANTNESGVFRTVAPPGPVLLMGGPNPGPNEGNKVYFKYEQLKPDPDYPRYFETSKTGELFGFRSPGGATTALQGQYCKVLNLKPDQTEVTADVILKPASKFTLKVQDPDGKPATEVLAAGNTARDWMYPTECEGDTCTVYGLDSAKPRLVVLYESKRQLAAGVNLKGTETEPVVVKLAPVAKVKGAMVNQDGKPIAKAIVLLNYRERPAEEIYHAIHGGRFSSETVVETNDAGEFTLDRVLPGLQFHVYARQGNTTLEPPSWKEGGFTVKPGETTDLGKVTLKGK